MQTVEHASGYLLFSVYIIVSLVLKYKHFSDIELFGQSYEGIDEEIFSKIFYDGWNR